MNPTQPPTTNQPDFTEPPPGPETTANTAIVSSLASSQGRMPGFLSRLPRPTLVAIVCVLGVLLLANSVAVVWLLVRPGPAAMVQLSAGNSGSQNSLSNVLSVDAPTKSVGVSAKKPQGLQVGSTIKTDPRGTANVRAGLLGGSPTVIFENSKGTQWQIGMNGDGLQYGQVGQALTNFGATTPQVVTTTGVDAKSTLTIQGTSVVVPNNLSLDNGTLYIDSVNHRVAVGAQNTQGYKLYVAGTLGVANSITTGQINVTGTVSAAQVTVSGTITASQIIASGNIAASGYLQAGGGPAWKIERLTGTISATDMDVAHGLGNSNRILMVEAYYLDSSNNAESILGYFNSSNVHLTNGIVGRPYRVTVMYSSDGAGW